MDVIKYQRYDWIHKALKYLRTKHKYTQAYVAAHLDIVKSTVGNHERGSSTPDLYTIIKYCNFYGLELSEFFHLVAISLDDTTPTKVSYDFTREKVHLMLLDK